MRRKSSPALYELIRPPAGDRPPPPPSDDDDGPPDVSPLSTAGHWLQPGRVLQVPVGYLFIAIVLLLVATFVSFMIGYSRGRDAEQLVYEEDLGLPRTVSAEQPRVHDPLETARPAATDGGNHPPSQGAAGRRASSRWGPITSDPREGGMEYYVLIETTEAGAMRLAEYCREHGLETYVVPGNNARRRVIALPAFESDQRASREAVALREEIHRLGEQWKAEGRGAWRYHEAYLSLYRD